MTSHRTTRKRKAGPAMSAKTVTTRAARPWFGRGRKPRALRGGAGMGAMAIR